jgi:hypothetical protein
MRGMGNALGVLMDLENDTFVVGGYGAFQKKMAF